MNEPNSNQDIIFVKDIIAACLRKWYFFIISGALILPIALFQIYKSENIYDVGATLLLDGKNKDNGYSGNQESFIKGQGIFSLQTRIEDEIGILTSYTLIRQVISELDLGVSYFYTHRFKTRELYKNTPFTVRIDSLHNQITGLEFKVKMLGSGNFHLTAKGEELTVSNLKENKSQYKLEEYVIDELMQFGEIYEDQHVKLAFEENPTYVNPEKGYFSFIIQTLDGLAQDHQGNLVVAPKSEKSNMISLSIEGTLVPMRVDFLDKLLEVYKRTDLEKQKEDALLALDIINDRLELIADSLQKSQDELKDLRLSISMIDLEANSTQLNQQISTQQIQATSLDSRRRYYEQVIKQFEEGATRLTSPDAMGVTDQMLTSLLTNLATLQQERAKLLLDAKEKSRFIKSIDKRIESARQSIIENVSSTLEGIRIESQGINDNINRLNAKMNKIPGGEAKLTNIQTQIKLLQTSYQYWLERRDQAHVSIASNIRSDKFIIDSAKQIGNSPVAPNKPMMLIIAMVIAGIIPLGLILVLNFFDDKIKNEDDIEKTTNIPILGYISQYEKRSNYIMEKDSRSNFAESFRALRIKMLYMTDQSPKQIIGLTSSASGEGKTFCATNLSATLAHSGKLTLLIDTDLRRPKVDKYFYTTSDIGLGNYLNGDVDYMNEVIQSTHIDNLHIITAGNVQRNATDLISNPKLEELILTCREEYDHIIFDTPPIGLVSDYLVLMHLTDFNIYVVRHKTTKPEDLKLINELYDTKKIQDVGLLINGVKSMTDYGYLDQSYGSNPYLNAKLPAPKQRALKAPLRRLNPMSKED